MAISSQTLTDQQDSVSWKWTANGQHTVASAYDCQFLGAMAFFLDTLLWKDLAEQKIKFFAWLVLHERVLTANNMAKKSWPCNPNCSLCVTFWWEI
jgi:hypothetical protein